MESESTNTKNIQQEDQEINVYDNDEAYMLNDENESALSNRQDDELNENDLNTNLKLIDEEINYVSHDPDEGEVNDENEGDEEEGEDEVEYDPEQDDTLRNKEINQNEEYDQYQDQDDGQWRSENQSHNEEAYRDGCSLITLKYISICQCCKTPFNSKVNIPYLLKCGHFFCKQCLEEKFTDDEGIKCPEDGLVGYSLEELKLLTNLITDKNMDINTSRDKYCALHKGQKWSHYIEDTKELICIYCAFTRFKRNPKAEIKEIKEKCNEINIDINNIIEDNQHNVEIIQDWWKDIKKNKDTEVRRANLFFDQILSYIQNKKKEILTQIESIFTDNAGKLSQKWEWFSLKMDATDKIKNMISALTKNDIGNFNDILEEYHSILREPKDENKWNLNLQEYHFTHEEENKTIKFINSWADLTFTPKTLMFRGNKNAYDFRLDTFQKMNTTSNWKYNDMWNTSEFRNNSFEFRHSQNERDCNKKLFSSSSQTKYIMSKYSYNKPGTLFEYKDNDTKTYNYGYK